MKQPEEWEFQAERILQTGRAPHFAPAEEELRVHREHLRDLASTLPHRPTMLVLGATPELADLGLEHGCRVYRVDSSRAMLTAAEPRQRVPDRGGETVLCVDWRFMDAIPDGAIDFVSGDAALNNVPIDDLPDLFGELRRVTHPGSVLSFKQIVFPDRIPRHYQLHEVLAAYRSGRLSDLEFYKLVRYPAFHAELFEEEGKILDAGKVFAAILNRKTAGVLTEEEFAFLYSRHGSVRHTVLTQSAQRKLFEQHLGPCEVVSPEGGCHYRDLFNVFRVVIAG